MIWLIFLLLGGCLVDSSNINDKSTLAQKFLSAYNHKPISNRIVEINLSADDQILEIYQGNTKYAWAYNGSIPGPVIRIKLGDTIRINFKNNLPQPTTIHFHGVRVPNAMDGVPGVTQDPIPPGGNFTYEFKPKDPGTYWFHPHVRGHEQLERGLYGALIVEDDMLFDKDVVVFLDDWLIDKNGNLYEDFDNVHMSMMNGRWGNIITVNGKPLEIINLKAGERLRLRLIDAANARIFYINHDANNSPYVIAVDGFYVRKPFPLNGFDMAPGNRLDLDIMDNESFYIYDGRSKKPLIYINISGSAPIGHKPINTKQYIPTLQEAENITYDRRYVYEIRMMPGLGPMWAINGRSWPNYEPYLFNYGTFNVVRLEDRSGRVHPIHFHGLFFKVLRRNGKFVDEGFYRDTVILYPRDVVDVVLVPVDRGEWLNHCHIQEHAERGFMTAIKVI